MLEGLWEFAQPVHMCFVDLEKAFDRVPRGILWGVLRWRVCPLRVGGEVLPQVEEFKYLGVLFTSEGKMEREIDRRIGAASAVMRSVYRTVVVKKAELSRKAKLSIYRSIYVPTLTYGHELWVMTRKDKITRIQAAEMSFLRRVAGRSLRDIGVRSSVTQRELRSRAAAPSHREESAEVAWSSVSDAPGLDASLGRCSRHVPPGGGPGHAGETMSLSWQLLLFSDRLRRGHETSSKPFVHFENC
ncbi:hypothetical protein L3Q82_009271 [Scortum barcoo]|uniref:Uncharacterized protein n=1 Tax=Scortum barcoo TaxID=214431 RepID=A0ACB8WGA3_9TELE|nr:hypothetical protein L3Q82_009271 [Scortum barcoo]